MNFKKGNLYLDENLDEYKFIGFTANSTIKRDGKLVMGAGNAKAVRDKFLGIDKVFGQRIKHLSNFYLLSVRLNNRNIFALQTKVNWKNDSSLHLVRESLIFLKDLCELYPNDKIACPYPGISNGNLNKSEVLELLKELPDNLDIWEY